MTEPTDAELWQLHMQMPGVHKNPIDFARAVLAKWATQPAVAKWAPEEIADGERGIRWVTNEGIHGRPTDHDVREYLKRTPTAHGCHCDECKQFYATQQPVAKVDWIGASSHHLMQKPDCGGESCDCRSYCKKSTAIQQPGRGLPLRR